MTTIKIELPDDQAAALRAKAAADGLSIEDWLRRRVEQEILRRRNRYTLVRLLEQCDPQAPLSAEDREWLGSHAIGRELL